MESCHLLGMLIFLILLLCVVTTTQPKFIIPPTSVNATLGSTATFTCSSKRGSINWIVNGSTLQELNRTDITVSPTVTSLYIPATEEYNNTNVFCYVAIHGEFEDFLGSDLVVLRVQGLLSSVTDLKAIPKPSSILLTWIQPFSLDITGVDPDLWYCIEVYNVTSVNTTSELTKLLSTNCSVYLPEFTFILNPPNPCDEFEFRVTPVNGAGNGSTGSPVNGHFLAEPESVHQVDVEVAVKELEFVVNISFTLEVCIGNNATSFEIYAVNDDEQLLQLHPRNTDMKSVDGQLMVVITVTFSDPNLNQIYSLLVEANNTVGSSNSTGSTSLSTNDVQGVNVIADSRQPGTVNISCTFASNTLARGFLAVIVQQLPALSSVLFSVALRDNSSSEAHMLVQGLAASTYDAVIFDIEKNGIPQIPNTLAAGTENVTVSSGPQFKTVLNTSGTATIRVAGNGSVCVTCTFTAFSDAMGCVALFLPDNVMKLLVRNITKPPNESSVHMCLNEEHGVYTVAVFERQSDGVISNSPANVSQITITVIPQETGTPTPPLVATLPSEGNTLVIIIALVLCSVAILAAVLGLIMFMVFKRKKGCFSKVKLPEEAVRYESSPEVVRPLFTEAPVEHYAHLNICQARVPVPFDRELVQYSEVDVKSLQQEARPESGPKTASPLSEQRRSLNVDNLFTELHSVKSEWQKLGEALGLDEDRLDEIFTINESEEECLRVMLEVWFQKSWKPTWRDVANALVAIGEDQLPERLYLMCDPCGTFTFRKSDFKHPSLGELQETQDDNPDLDRLTTDLSPVASKWLELGIQLEIPMEELNAIGTHITGEQGKAEVCLQRVVLEWLSNSTKPITRDVLVEALGSSSVGEVHCAKELPQDTFAAITLEFKPNALLKHLKPIAAKYHALGVQLGLTPAKIREFETEAYGQGVKLYLKQVLHRWLDGDPQLDLLLEALIEIDNRRLAEKLKKDYAGKDLVLLAPKCNSFSDSDDDPPPLFRSTKESHSAFRVQEAGKNDDPYLFAPIEESSGIQESQNAATDPVRVIVPGIISTREWIKISSGRPVVQSFTAAYHAGGTMVEWDVTTSNFTPGCQCAEERSATEFPQDGVEESTFDYVSDEDSSRHLHFSDPEQLSVPIQESTPSPECYTMQYTLPCELTSPFPSLVEPACYSAALHIDHTDAHAETSYDEYRPDFSSKYCSESPEPARQSVVPLQVLSTPQQLDIFHKPVNTGFLLPCTKPTSYPTTKAEPPVQGNDLTNLTTLLLPVGNKWNQLGKELGLCDVTLGIIRNTSYGYLLRMSEWYYFCLKEVLTIWLKKNLPKDELAEALIKIGEENLARSICATLHSDQTANHAERSCDENSLHLSSQSSGESSKQSSDTFPDTTLPNAIARVSSASSPTVEHMCFSPPPKSVPTSTFKEGSGGGICSKSDPFSSVMAFPANTCSTDPGTGKGVPTFTILTDRNSETLSGSSPTVDAGDSILPQQQESIGCIEKSFLLLNQFTGATIPSDQTAERSCDENFLHLRSKLDPIQVSKATQQPDSAHKPVESTSFLVPWPKPASYSRTKDEPLKDGSEATATVSDSTEIMPTTAAGSGWHFQKWEPKLGVCQVGFCAVNIRESSLKYMKALCGWEGHEGPPFLCEHGEPSSL